MSYEVLESRKTYEGKIVTITVDKLRMPDGSEAYRETVIRKKNAAGVLAVDTDGRLLFVRQYRHPFREMLLEIPAGVIEEGESGEAAVLRELEEETGRRRLKQVMIAVCRERGSGRKKYQMILPQRNFSASCIPLSASVRKKFSFSLPQS